MSLEIPGIGQKNPIPDYPRMETQKQSAPAPRQAIDGGKQPDSADSRKRQAQYEKLLEQLFNTVAPYDTQLKYTINRELGEVVVKVIDTKTDKVIKEIPSADIQRLQEKIREAVGLLIDQKI